MHTHLYAYIHTCSHASAHMASLDACLDWTENTTAADKYCTLATYKAKVRGNYTFAETYFKRALQGVDV